MVRPPAHPRHQVTIFTPTKLGTHFIQGSAQIDYFLFRRFGWSMLGGQQQTVILEHKQFYLQSLVLGYTPLSHILDI